MQRSRALRNPRRKSLSSTSHRKQTRASPIRTTGENKLEQLVRGERTCIGRESTPDRSLTPADPITTSTGEPAAQRYVSHVGYQICADDAQVRADFRLDELPAKTRVSKSWSRMIIYPASKTAHLDHWRALRAAGLDIRASWLDSEINTGNIDPSKDAWARHWSLCCSEAAAADVVLLYACEDERQCGALIEAGCALGAGKQVWCVSPHKWSFRNHPRVRNFDTLEAAVAALVAIDAGERC